ncbi:hypothetical protein FRAAL6228 [Frankia alni ACN14a]|uniref:Uncharacterized protein n=1 Tax=Frankia alni (strain DSM 45986 / CECT 9034 / ACN14a) TaxID=326424 RepID=Q0RCH3_FRAAA|nr:hypothetical protein FRAAL6228 [Frankia alni ACN14a]
MPAHSPCKNGTRGGRLTPGKEPADPAYSVTQDTNTDDPSAQLVTEGGVPWLTCCVRDHKAWP